MCTTEPLYRNEDNAKKISTSIKSSCVRFNARNMCRVFVGLCAACHCAPDYNRSIYEIIYSTCVCVQILYGFWTYFGLSRLVWHCVVPLFFWGVLKLAFASDSCFRDWFVLVDFLIWVAYLVVLKICGFWISGSVCFFVRLIEICFNEHRKLIQWIDCWINIKYPVDAFKSMRCIENSFAVHK